MTGVDWAEVAAREYAVPEGVYPPDVLDELLGMLASEDPEVRDRQAYSTLAHWMGAGQFDVVLPELGEGANLGLEDPSVLLRSFSALVLGEVVQRDAEQPIVPAGLWQSWLERWQDWYPHEPDVRSHDPSLGWIHAVAHGADTARAFALHPATTSTDLRTILDTLTKRLRSLPLHLNQTEDDRLALALLAVLSRTELGEGEIRAWLTEYQTLWTPPAFPLAPGPALAIRTLHSLHTLLHLRATVDGVTLRPAYSEATLAAVQNALRSVYPYYGGAQTA